MILDGAAIAEHSVSGNAADPRSLLLALPCDMPPLLSTGDCCDMWRRNAELSGQRGMRDSTLIVSTPDGANLFVGQQRPDVSFSASDQLGPPPIRSKVTWQASPLHDHVRHIVNLSTKPQVPKTGPSNPVDNIDPRIVVSDAGRVVASVKGVQRGRDFDIGSPSQRDALSVMGAAVQSKPAIASTGAASSPRPATHIGATVNLGPEAISDRLISHRKSPLSVSRDGQLALRRPFYFTRYCEVTS